jgi:hypothetical protein
MLATATPNSWSAQFFYALGRFGLGLEGLATEDEDDAPLPGFSPR